MIRSFLIGLLLMLGGVVTLFGMIVGFFEGGLFLALLAFVATLVGMAVGLAGVVRQIQKRPPPGQP